MFPRKRQPRLFVWLFLILITFTLMGAQARGGYEKSARISVEGKATKDVKVVFEFKPEGGDAIQIEVKTIKKGDNEGQPQIKI